MDVIIKFFLLPELLFGLILGAFNRPRFEGAGEGGTWYILKSADGKASRIIIASLEISNYVMAISLNGAQMNVNVSDSENVIHNNIFSNIGQIFYLAGKPSTAIYMNIGVYQGN